jgi:predicted nucleotidyltransferase
MIPDFYDGEFLPDGEHLATWEEVHARFGSPCEQRKTLSLKLKYYLDIARRCGFIRVYVFGSFISGRLEPPPGDIDLMWVYQPDLDIDALSKECRDLLNYDAMRRREQWDMFCCSDNTGVINYLLGAFRISKDNKSRGVILIHLQ